VGDQKGNH
jgi:hypothetical protein